jgi:tetratricopeptide (TPR) repeat protein
MTATAPTLSSEEQEQLQQTIEMFEVIVQASPQDCQSLEILKDAYNRLGRLPDAMQTTRRLADTYRDLGQFSQAFLEYEWLLQKEPSNMEVMAAMGEIEEKLLKETQARKGAKAPKTSAPGLKFDYSTLNVDAGTLITTEQTQRGSSAKDARHGATGDDGSEVLARFLIQNRIAPEDVVTASLDRVEKKNITRTPNALAVSLLDEISRRASMEMETLLSGILDRSKFAYIPLEYYEVDRAVVRMLPEEITLGRLIVPFDVMSRTLMVAMANPFDGEGKEMVQQLLDYNIQWHIASPTAISKVLAETYKLGNALMAGGGLRLAS